MIAIKCWRDDAKAQAAKLQPGDVVQVVGRIKSRRWNDKLFTDFEGEKITVLSATSGQHRVERDAGTDDDDVGF